MRIAVIRGDAGRVEAPSQDVQRRALVRVDVQQPRAAGADTIAEGLRDARFVVQSGAVDHLDDELSARIDGLTVADEVIVARRVYGFSIACGCETPRGVFLLGACFQSDFQ